MNPIIQALNKKPNGNILSAIASIKNGNPDAMYNQLMQTDPRFRRFIQENQGKSPEQIAKEHGIDTSLLK